MDTQLRTDFSGVDLFDQRGQVVTVHVTTTMLRSQHADGSWSDWALGTRVLRLDEEPVDVVDNTTLEVVRTKQRLSLDPPLSGG